MRALLGAYEYWDSMEKGVDESEAAKRKKDQKALTFIHQSLDEKMFEKRKRLTQDEAMEVLVVMAADEDEGAEEEDKDNMIMQIIDIIMNRRKTKKEVEVVVVDEVDAQEVEDIGQIKGINQTSSVLIVIARAITPGSVKVT
ncbi:Unknown protein [Striga hermonthica]|uniref:Uncharacterized protein n=1 Tax=Striga hermonthica TaxID=68872 RepID=A0A9N7RBB9_STRHE|nr:Unknown protein [Striga hermonthica]